MYRNDYKVTIPQFLDKSINVLELGIIPGVFDENTGRKNASIINKAIEELSNQGGGNVIIPAGFFAVAPITLKSNINLHLEKQATLKFTKSKEDYPLFITDYEGLTCIRCVSPITARNCKNVAITGDGVIDGSGDLWRPIKQFKLTERQWTKLLKKSSYVVDTKEGGIWMPNESIYNGNKANIQGTDEASLLEAANYYDFYRPVMVDLSHCENVLLSGVTFMNSPAWNIHPFFCDNLTVCNVTIRNPYYAQNGDGIDVESCTNVHIHDSVFETGDDAICIKAGKNAKAREITGPCSNIHIHDCTVLEGHGGFVIGSEMSRGVSDILVEKCTFLGTDVGIRMKSAMGRGGKVTNITVKDINMVDIKEEAIILTMSYVLNSLDKNETIAMENEDDIPYFSDITMKQINCCGCNRAIKSEPIGNIINTIANITIKNSNFSAKSDNIINGENIKIENCKFDIQ